MSVDERTSEFRIGRVTDVKSTGFALPVRAMIAEG